MNVKQVDQYHWELPLGSVPNMRVPGLIFADSDMIQTIKKDGSLRQVAQVATLPGAIKASMAMPDIHFGYGFPIGGVLATQGDDGVISPGGVGFDINCGVRLLKTPLKASQITPQLQNIIQKLFSEIPSGVGSGGKLKLRNNELRDVVRYGSRWAVDKGYGSADDLLHTEAGGCMDGADPETISSHAFERGHEQLGTLGSGNHFIEIQRVDAILDQAAADAFGLVTDQITIMIHSGSRGLGHQVCTDYLKVMGDAIRKYRIQVPDRQLACAPLSSPEGQRYLSAMKGAANYAWANRQCLSHWVRDVFQRMFHDQCSIQNMPLLYDVAHNIVKIEEHRYQGKRITVAVHRKGATRAWGPGTPEIPVPYQSIGQPVLIPGDMGTASYILAGTTKAMTETFGSACHGAGRLLSRKAAMQAARGRSIVKELSQKGIVVRAAGRDTIDEEMPEAYKNIDSVIRVIDQSGIATLVARLVPMGVIKG